MILTITMNPSIDIAYSLEDFHLDAPNRVRQVKKTAGGKGLNVTRVLKQLDEDVFASGLLGGFLGEEIKASLTQAGIGYDFFPISGETRNCIAILHGGMQTEILESGPIVAEREAELFLAHFELLLGQAGLVGISGSLADGLPAGFYAEMVKCAQEKGVKVMLDVSGKPLEAVLWSPAKPFLIKPNLAELGELIGRSVSADTDELKEVLSDGLFEGIPWIVISLGKDGAFAKIGSDFHQVRIPQITAVNPVGSGDATVAGLLSGLYHKDSPEDVLKKAMTLGMLNACEPETGSVDLNRYQELFEQVTVIQN
ncbi:tagatose-6-phosphate kinase 2 [Listeria floridensis FSL S10-1187]|uniref:Tagatose-6-phosphate kinase n=1 Tax=Listeria floridensis FSL S10-1187 TaxID=1265817 RepID=A0ABP3AXM3_9LIST|nr:tagatose-6-phosphate kinase [Listeria floridensis]EUJ31374.1 tagatose-6-phosphate kinase 2 [Listeria floridensis FSL S10-1187]